MASSYRGYVMAGVFFLALVLLGLLVFSIQREETQSFVQDQVDGIREFSEESPQQFNYVALIVFGFVSLGMLTSGVYVMYRNIYSEHDLTKRFSVAAIVNRTAQIQRYINAHPEDDRNDLEEQLRDAGWDPDLIEHAFNKLGG